MATTAEEIEVDPSLDIGTNDDSDYGTSIYGSSTESLSSSISEYIFENGKLHALEEEGPRYHAYYGTEKNMLPTDEKEQDRLDMHHEIILQILEGRLFDAPIGKTPQKILDVGTGTGIWAIDVADMFPMAEVSGTDLSPIQPKWVPPNCKFEVDDAERRWTYKEGLFDFIHCRNLGGSINNWSNLAAEIYRCTKPGGYAELAELGSKVLCDDGTMKDDNPFKIYSEVTIKAMEAMGRTWPTANSLVQTLKNAGFVDVTLTVYKQPFGPWPKDKRLKHIGAMAMVMAETGLEAYGLAAMTRILKMDPVEAMAICKDAFKAIKNRHTHMYNELFVVYGKKPE